MDSLETLPLILDLFRVREIRQAHATVVESRAAANILASPQLVEVRHGVGLADLVLAQLIQI